MAENLIDQSQGVEVSRFDNLFGMGTRLSHLIHLPDNESHRAKISDLSITVEAR